MFQFKKYVKNSSNLGKPTTTSNQDGSTTLVWTREVNAGVSEELTYTVLVTGDVDIVHNKATVKYGDGPEIEIPELSNPVKTDGIIDVPNTASTIAIASVITGIVLVGAGGYLVYRRYNKA